MARDHDRSRPESVQVTQGEVVGHAHVQGKTLPFAIFAQQPRPLIPAGAWRRRPAESEHPDFTTTDALQPEQNAKKLGTPRSHEAVDPEDFAAVNRQ